MKIMNYQDHKKFWNTNYKFYSNSLEAEDRMLLLLSGCPWTQETWDILKAEVLTESQSKPGQTHKSSQSQESTYTANTESHATESTHTQAAAYYNSLQPDL